MSRFTLPLFLVFVLYVELSEAFVRYGLLRQNWPQWQASAKCRAQGYDGLAVIDDPSKWQAAQLQMAAEKLPSTQDVWIGLNYDLVKSKAEWSGGKVYWWGGWGTGQPDWTRIAVVITHEGNQLVWKTQGSNYENWSLCSKESDRLKMSRHPNRNVNLSGVTALSSDTKSAAEDCGILCGSMTACAYFTFSAANGACSLYAPSVNTTLAVDHGTPSSLLVFQMVSY